MIAGIFNRHSPKRGERYDPADTLPILENPRGFYTDEYRKILRDRLARIQCPILIIQGDQDDPINKFNTQVLIPELRALKNAVEVITYHGELTRGVVDALHQEGRRFPLHCFCFYGAPHPPMALKAFRDCEAFFRQHVKTKPKPLESDSVKYEPA